MFGRTLGDTTGSGELYVALLTVSVTIPQIRFQKDGILHQMLSKMLSGELVMKYIAFSVGLLYEIRSNLCLRLSLRFGTLIPYNFR